MSEASPFTDTCITVDAWEPTEDRTATSICEAEAQSSWAGCPSKLTVGEQTKLSVDERGDLVERGGVPFAPASQQQGKSR